MDNRVADTEDQNQGNHRFYRPDAKFWAAETFANLRANSAGTMAAQIVAAKPA